MGIDEREYPYISLARRHALDAPTITVVLSGLLVDDADGDALACGPGTVLAYPGQGEIRRFAGTQHIARCDPIGISATVGS
jgi:hypothetical protein